MSATPVKKTKTVKQPASHPTYQAMVKAAIKAANTKKGVSKAAILKYILQTYKVGDNIKAINGHVRMALRTGVKKGMFTQPKGTGASGSFRLSEAAKKAPKPKKVKKTKAPKAKKATPKKKTASPKKKVVKKPKAAPKKVKTPTKKAAAKKPVAKKAVKKTPAKKVAPKKKTAPKNAA